MTTTMAQAVWPRSTQNPTLAWGRDILLMLMFSLLTGLSAHLTIYLPGNPVPITGQTFGVLLTGSLLGSRLGLLTMALYLVEGLIGLPVFAPSKHPETATLLGLSFGYLLSYPFAAALIGRMAERGWDRSPVRTLTAMLAGSVIIYAIGAAWLAHFVGPVKAVQLGVLPFLIGDTLKALLAAGLLPLGWKLLGDRR